MPRLPRPHIPLEVRCRVVLRQLGEMFVEAKLNEVATGKTTFAAILVESLDRLASLLGVESRRLFHLDHDPALENREKLVLLPSGRKVRAIVVPDGAEVLRYFPDANDPEYLFYREKHAHHIKTNVRGDGAQYADNVLAKRERRRAKKAGKKRVPKKPSRSLRSANRWPPRGIRKVNWRKT